MAVPHFPFDAIKGREAVARVLAAVPRRSRTVFHVLKLLYLAEREALRQYGRPIVGGIYSELHDGPIISPVYDLTKAERDDYKANQLGAPEWDPYISRHGKYELALVQEPPRLRLSVADARILDAVVAEHGSKSFPELWAYVHNLQNVPEYDDPGEGNSRQIRPEALLRAVGFNEEQIAATLAEMEELSHEHGEIRARR